MSITKEQKQDIIKQYALKDKDTGSVEVQCAIISTRIANLAAHMKVNPKDVSARRGLLFLVNQRRRLLNYLKRNDVERYHGLISRLGLRK